MFGDRYLRNVIMGLNARLELLKQSPEWASVGTETQNGHSVFELFEKVDTALPVEKYIDWIGFPAVPYKILEYI